MGVEKAMESNSSRRGKNSEIKSGIQYSLVLVENLSRVEVTLIVKLVLQALYSARPTISHNNNIYSYRNIDE